jgi:hypothetical protein
MTVVCIMTRLDRQSCKCLHRSNHLKNRGGQICLPKPSTTASLSGRMQKPLRNTDTAYLGDFAKNSSIGIDSLLLSINVARPSRGRLFRIYIGCPRQTA